jgi:hypothetical protein
MTFFIKYIKIKKEMQKSLKEILETQQIQIQKLTTEDKTTIVPFVLDYLKLNIDKSVNSFKISEAYKDEFRKELKDYKLRKIINHLRGIGNPISSGSRGYKYTTDKKEIIETIMSMRLRNESMNYAITGLLSYLD